MEVLSYLELWQKDSEFIDKYCEFLERDTIDFYSQPFKPELITELFEGWEFDKRSLTAFRNSVDTETVEFDVNGKMKIHQLSTDVFPYPRTLDDFINDCKRAGIELEWRENERY